MPRTLGSYAQSTAPKVTEHALRLFAQHGYAAVSMRQIAKEVGVQVGTLYNYTPDKQTLLFDIMKRHLEDLLSAWSLRPHKTDPVLCLRDFIEFHLRYHMQKQDAVFVSYMELRSLTSENFIFVEKLRGQYETILEEILSQGQSAGLFLVSDPKVTTLAVIGMLKEVITWYKPEGRLTLEEIIEIYQGMIADILHVGLNKNDPL